jgi:hypothetical protein
MASPSIPHVLISRRWDKQRFAGMEWLICSIPPPINITFQFIHLQAEKQEKNRLVGSGAFRRWRMGKRKSLKRSPQFVKKFLFYFSFKLVFNTNLKIPMFGSVFDKIMCFGLKIDFAIICPKDLGRPPIL